MKARVTISAAAVALLFASQASASVISASSQTARSKPADQVDYMSVTSMQTDLNMSMREAADASAPAALGSRAPSTASGGFLLSTDAQAGDMSGRAIENLFSPDRDKGASDLAGGVAGPGTVIANGSNGGGRGGNHGGGYNGGRWGNDGRRGGGNDNDKKGGNVGTHGGHKKDGGWKGHKGGGHHGGGGGVQAAPEPSTWLLLGAGLTMVGLYEVVRRRS
jgi:hypothetical protein